jgi:hypothetical protein
MFEDMTNIKFEWDELFTGENTNVNYTINEQLNKMFTSSNYLLSVIEGKCPDMLDKTAFNISFMKGGIAINNTDKVTSPGVFTCKYAIDAEGVEPKYYGESEFSFTVEKKDLSKATGSNAIQFWKDNAVFIGDVANVVEYTYNGFAIPFKADFTAEQIQYNNILRIVVEYKVKGADDNTYIETAPIENGEYVARVRLIDRTTNIDHINYICKTTIQIKINKASVLLTVNNLGKGNNSSISQIVTWVTFILPNGVKNEDGTYSDATLTKYYAEGCYKIMTLTQQSIFVDFVYPSTPGTYTAFVVMQGNYAGYIQVTFTIND